MLKHVAVRAASLVSTEPFFIKENDGALYIIVLQIESNLNEFIRFSLTTANT